MAWYLPWHLPILPAAINSIFRNLIPRSRSDVPRCSPLHPTVHNSSSLPSNTLSHLLPLSKTKPNPHTSQISQISQILLQQLDLLEMEFLEIQFEPISLRFYSLSASSTGGSLLTLIAVLAAAAVGFWRIRTVGSKTDGSEASSLFTAPLEETQQKVAPLVQSTEEEEEEEDVSPACSVDRSTEIVGTPKVRFTAYFEKEDCVGCCHVEDEAEEEEPSVEVEFAHREVELPWEREEEVEVKWEAMAMRRRGDLGWYSHQDMAVLNGSVVRFWDGDSPRRKKGSISISSF